MAETRLSFPVMEIHNEYKDYIKQVDIALRRPSEEEIAASSQYAQIALEKLLPENPNTPLTTDSLIQTIRKDDLETATHGEGVTVFALLIGEELGLSDYELYELKLAAEFHDLGKLGMMDLVKKPGDHTEEETAVMRLHGAISEELAILLNLPPTILPVLKDHHIRYDELNKGYGQAKYPPTLARLIITLADHVDAAHNDRPYKKGKSLDEVYEEFTSLDLFGTVFHPELQPAFEEVMRKLMEPRHN